MFLNGLGVAAYFSKELNAMVEQKLDHVRARHDRYAKVAALSHVDHRIVQLETTLTRSLLLLEAMTEACVSKGMLTRDEISQMAEKIDLDRIAQFAPEEEVMDTTASSPEEYFHRLEERDRRELECGSGKSECGSAKGQTASVGEAPASCPGV
jgi:hypothetical protein